jgi:hypothetical protein
MESSRWRQLLIHQLNNNQIITPTQEDRFKSDELLHEVLVTQTTNEYHRLAEMRLTTFLLNSLF